MVVKGRFLVVCLLCCLELHRVGVSLFGNLKLNVVGVLDFRPNRMRILCWCGCFSVSPELYRMGLLLKIFSGVAE